MSARQWTTALRVENRRGVTRYVVSFSNGVTRASLFGTLRPFNNSPADQKLEAWECALDWMAHITPTPRKLTKPILRNFFPANRERRKHGFRRAAA